MMGTSFGIGAVFTGMGDGFNFRDGALRQEAVSIGWSIGEAVTDFFNNRFNPFRSTQESECLG